MTSTCRICCRTAQDADLSSICMCSGRKHLLRPLCNDFSSKLTLARIFVIYIVADMLFHEMFKSNKNQKC